MTLEGRLREKALAKMRELRGLRSPRTHDVFERLAYVFPSDLAIANYPRKPVAAFNPGAALRGRELLVFPRTIFEYYNYTSSICLFAVDVERLLSGELEKPVSARVVLWPDELWEFRGCEGARVYAQPDGFLMLYTGFGYHHSASGLELKWVQGLAVLDSSLEVLKKGYFRIEGAEGSFAPKMKDSAILRLESGEAVLLCRPTLGDVEVCWRGTASLDRLAIEAESMEPVLAHEEWEFKVGWSTNVIQLSSNEYLIGWHGVLKGDYSYREGFALLDGSGELLAVSDYLLTPRGIVEKYGDRPLVIFGDGLILHRGKLLWVGGVSDYAIGFFAAELEKVMEEMRWLRG
ncbi:MAG: hypothetical protein QXU72_02645 [Thermofilum sp.]